jgi:hypothetical protein
MTNHVILEIFVIVAILSAVGSLRWPNGLVAAVVLLGIVLLIQLMGVAR